MTNETTNTTDTKEQALEILVRVYEGLEKSKLASAALDKLDNELKFLEGYLKCSRIQAALFSIIFAMQNANGQGVVLKQLAEYLDEPLLHVLKYRKEIDTLDSCGLLNAFPGLDEKYGLSYSLNRNIEFYIIDNIPLPEKIAEKNSEEIITEFYDLICYNKSGRRDESLYDAQCLGLFEFLEKKYKENEIVRNVTQAYPSDINTRILVYSLVFRVLFNGDYQDQENDEVGFSFNIFPTSSRNRIKSAIECGTHPLCKEKLINIRDKNINISGLGITKVIQIFSLSQKGIDTFLGSEAAQYQAEEDELTEKEELGQFLRSFGHKFESICPNKHKIELLKRIERNYASIKFVKKATELISNEIDRFVFYYCCNYTFNMGKVVQLLSCLSSIYSGISDAFYDKIREYQKESNFLLKEGFLIIEKAEYIQDATLEPSDRTIEMLHGKNADIFQNKTYKDNIIDSEKLKEKTLFYSPEMTKQIDLLKETFKEQNLIAIQKRLEEKALPTGIVALLYGAPGTGKTETAYQLAKSSGRKIYHVDISETKSCWFGESEKIIKKIFTNYKNLCKSCQRRNEKIPILLFNEADAIISKRKNIDTGGNVAQTENAMQNIILEQLEKFDGIMLATTNLCDNIDRAFERRFLFKIKYEKPCVSERKKIWQDKLPFLSESETNRLAQKYNFSGGEIDNIVRKCQLDEVVSGKQPNFAKIDELCKFERLQSEDTKTVGFTV